MIKTDVIVMGGGPNGLADALALGGFGLPRPLQVLVLDARDPRKTTSDTRGTAITRSTQTMFETLGLWDDLRAHSTELHQAREKILVLCRKLGQLSAKSIRHIHRHQFEESQALLDEAMLVAIEVRGLM